MNSHPVSGIHEFRARVVALILNGKPELSLRLLARHYEVREPTLRVGTVKGHRKVLACYVEKEKRIYLSNSGFVTDPFVVLHEFYHHLRASKVGKTRQVETRADLFATDFIRDFLSCNELIGGRIPSAGPSGPTCQIGGRPRRSPQP